MGLEAGEKRLFGVRRAGVRSEGESGEPPAALPLQGSQLPDEGIAVVARHGDVAHQHFRPAVFDGGERVADRSRRRHLRTVVSKHGRQQLTGVCVIVDDEDSQPIEQRPRGRHCLEVGAGRLRGRPGSSRQER